jgi:hypothetical protein
MNERTKWLFGVLAVFALWATYAAAQQPMNVAQVGGVAPIAAICNDESKISSVNINLTATTGNTEIVALSGSTVIYVCGYQLIVGGADGTQWITGTGTACATGETDKATFNFAAAGDGIAAGNAGYMIFKTAAGGALCVERTNSVTLSGIVSYVQQ